MNTETQRYDITIRGHLDHHWAARLHAETLEHTDDGNTAVTTTPIDQSQLHGLLAQLRDISAPLTLLQERVPATGPNPTLTLPLTTERLTLRPATPSDAEATWNYRRLPEVAQWLTELPHDPAAYERTFTDPDRLATTVIIELDHTVIGDFMLRIDDAWAQTEVRHQARSSQAELGWTLDPTHTGHGYATEAAQALLDYSFDELRLRRVVANCFADNTASVRLIERLGMRCEQHARSESLHRSGQWMDTLGFALLVNERGSGTAVVP